ncbi:MAG: molybdopterin converting factor subunit 1 [Phycisphaeraceae bacterium]
MKKFPQGPQSRIWISFEVRLREDAKRQRSQQESVTRNMTVRVLIFGILVDKLGQRELAISLPDAATAGDLLSMLAADCPVVAAMRDRIAVAVNMEYAARARVLSEGDEVALIPPVSGG